MKSIYSALLFILLVSCQNNFKNKFEKLEQMNWLIGNWENKMTDGILTETWTKANDSVFEGTSYYFKGKDTIHLENIRLIQKGDGLVYSTTIKGQNNDEPVDFKLTSEKETEFTFENPAHDYPQKITYNKIKSTHFLTTISGKQQGNASQESYSMKRK